jgi:hypothetical protein
MINLAGFAAKVRHFLLRDQQNPGSQRGGLPFIML